MGIRFRCHHCEHELNVKDFQAGKKTRCPGCNERFRIPMKTSDYSEAVEERVSDPRTAASLPSTNASSTKTAPDEKKTTEKTPASNSEAIPETNPSKSASDTSAPSPSAAADSEIQWYVRPPSGGQFGPANQVVFEQWLGENRVSADSLVWRNGWNDWQVANQALPNHFPGTQEAGTAIATSPSPATADTPNLSLDSGGLASDPIAASSGAGSRTSGAENGNPRDLSLSERNRLDRRRKKRRNYRITIGILTLLAIGLLAGLIIAIALQQK